MGFSTNIVIASGNVLSDLMLLVVPVVMLSDAAIPLIRKFKIGALLSLGLFVISFDIVRCVLSLASEASGASGSSWAQREAVRYHFHPSPSALYLATDQTFFPQIVAIVAVNAPHIHPIFKREFWRRSGTQPSVSTPKNTNGQSIQTVGQQRWRKITHDTEIYKMTNFETRTGSAESQADLVNENDQKHQHHNPTQPWQSATVRTKIETSDNHHHEGHHAA